MPCDCPCRDAGAPWREIGGPGPRQQARRRRPRRPDRPGDPGRDRRPLGPAAAARGHRGGQHPDVLQDLTANAALLTLLAGPRWAIGARDLALLGAPRRRRSSGTPRPGRPVRRHPRTSCDAAVSGVDPAELVSLAEALDDPGRAAVLARGARRGSGCSPASCAGCAGTSASRCSTWSGGSSTTAARGRAGVVDVVRWPRPGATTSTSSSTRSRSSGRRRQVHARGTAGLPRGRGRLRPGSRRRAPQRRPTRSSCSPSTVPRASSGTSCSSRRWPRACSRSTAPASTWLTVPFVMPTPLRGDARDRPALHAVKRRPSPTFTAATKEHERVEERRLAYVAMTRPRHRLRGRRHWWGPRRKAGRGPSASRGDVREMLAARGDGPRAVVRPAHQGRPNPTPPSIPPAVADVAPAPRRSPAGTMRPRSSRCGRGAGGGCPLGRRPDDMLVSRPVQEWDVELARLLDEATPRPARR